MANIKERIELMKGLNIINGIGYSDLMKILNILELKTGVLLTDENSGMLITHIAAMFQRNQNKEEIHSIGEEIIEEIESDELYNESLDLFNELKKNIDNEISKEEKWYVLLHIRRLLNERQEA